MTATRVSISSIQRGDEKGHKRHNSSTHHQRTHGKYDADAAEFDFLDNLPSEQRLHWLHWLNYWRWSSSLGRVGAVSFLAGSSSGAQDGRCWDVVVVLVAR